MERHRHHALTLFALLAGSVTALAAPTSAHAGGIGGVGGIFDNICGDPSPADCRSTAYWKTYCAAQKRDKCNATLTADYAAARAGLPTADVVVPDGLPSAGTHETVPVKPYDSSKDNIYGYWATYSGRTLNRRAAAKQPWDIISPGMAKRMAFAANGAKVASCEEYVFERYKSWSDFEDVTGDMGRNWPAIYDEAMKYGSSIENGVIRSITGVHVWDIKWDTVTPGPKNDFFAQPYWDGTAATVTQYAGGFKYNFDPRIASWMSVGRIWRKPSWSDLRFWGYVAAFGKTADDYDQLARLKRQYKDLWLQRTGLQPKFMQCQYHYLKPDMAAYCFGATTAADMLNNFQWQAFVLDYQIEATLLQANDMGCFANDHVTWCDWSAQEWVDQIRNQVRAEQEKSFQRCVRFTGDDFSASGLVEYVKTSGMPEIAQPAYYATGAVIDDITRSPDALDVFFAKVEVWLNGLSFPKDPHTKRPTIGDARGDYLRMGGEMFAASVSYGAGWYLYGFTGPGTRISDAQGYANGYFDASATVFGKEQSLISANAAAYSQNDNEVVMHRYFNVLGLYVYSPPDEVHPLDWSFAIAPSWNGKIFGASMWISVCGIPVNLQAGVSGLVELDGNLHVGVNRDRVNDKLGMRVNGTLKPIAQVDGYASGAASIGIVTVGVKIAVTILRAELPLTLDMQVALSSNGQVLLTASATLDLVLRTLDGRVSAFIDYFWDDAEVTLFSWQGLSDTTRLFRTDFTSAPLVLIKTFLDAPAP